MADGVLVDSSAWIEFFRRAASPVSDLIDRLLEEDRVFVVPPVLAEVVSGARNRRESERLRSVMSSLPRPEEPADLWDRIADVQFELARKGIQTSILDLWIAVAASSAGLRLLTLDSDFDRIASVVPVKLLAIR